MFDEYLEPPRVKRPVSPASAVPVSVNLAGRPSSTSIDQVAPSLSHSPSSSELQSLCLHQGVAAESTLMDENLFAPVDNDPFINIFASEPTSLVGVHKVLQEPDLYKPRSYIFDSWIDKFKARTKSGSCSTLCTPTNKQLKILFQPMFDEYLEPPRVERPVSPALAVPVSVNLAGRPSSTSIDQVAPCPSHSPSSSELQSLCLHQGVAAESTLMDENLFAPIDNDPFINIFASEPTSKASSFEDASLAESNYVTQTLYHLEK
nr:hypothetical protein [Tanacetum cinerariifolium]